MRPDFIRVVYDNQPYLVLRDGDGSLGQAYGPFTPGSEPNLAECTEGTRIVSGSLLARLAELMPISPPLPSHEDTLAGS